MRGPLEGGAVQKTKAGVTPSDLGTLICTDSIEFRQACPQGLQRPGVLPSLGPDHWVLPSLWPDHWVLPSLGPDRWVSSQTLVWVHSVAASLSS